MARDIFVFYCHTRFAYCDFYILTKSNIVIGIDVNKWLITKREKTSAQVRVTLLDKEFEIIEKYTEHPKIFTKWEASSYLFQPKDESIY